MRMQSSKAEDSNLSSLFLQREKSSLSTGAYHWAIGRMLHYGVLLKRGYDEYSISDGIELPEYVLNYSDAAVELMNIVSRRYPQIQFTLFETALLNDFLNHLIAQNTVFVQAEKGSSVFVFRFLQEAGFKNLLYKPNLKGFNLYWVKDSVVVTDMISEAPLRTINPHKIMLEKMLVDLCADKLISGIYGKTEFQSVLEMAKERYRLDRRRMLRYVRRRNKEEAIRRFLESEVIA